MPTGTALSTTKRKFHRILDSISNASSTSLATKSNHDKYNASTTTLPATMDPPAKKPRITRPASAYVPPSTRILTSQSPNLRAAAATAKQPNPVATMNEERKTPNFAPWDRGQFLERLKTYRHVDKWMGKPERINEVQWAKRGWSCVGKERVGCVGGCGKEVVIILESVREERQDTEKRPSDEEEDEDEWRDKAQEQLVEKYAEMIVTSHEGGCLWRRKGCDGMLYTLTALADALMNPADTIQRLPLANHKTAIDDLRQRYHSLVAIAAELPPDPFTPEGFDLSSISQNLAPLLHPPSLDPPSTPPSSPPNPPADTTNTTTTPPSPIKINNPSALALSLFGWQAEPGHVAGLATCTACFRRLGLWLFKPSSSSSPPSQSSMHRLDVLTEHRDYCPWINALAQNGTTSRQRTSLDGLTGWEALLRAVNAGVVYQRHENEDKRGPVAAVRSGDGGGAGSDVASIEEESSVAVSREETGVSRDERDKERWAKLKRLKQAFHVKRRKGKGNGNGETKGADGKV
ncbi:MAG: hypothetical protein Q9161_006761 [Pseudevernia consocians]